MKTVFFIVFIGLLMSCVPKAQDNLETQKGENCIQFSDAFSDEVFFQILRDNSTIVNSSCNQLNVYYKPLSQEEEKEFFREFNSHVEYLAETFSDSSYYTEDYEKIDVGKSKVCPYSNGTCNYYTQFIYQSKNKNIIYLRLFHNNLTERYELLLKRNDTGDYDLLVVG